QQDASIELTMTVSNRNECGTSDSATIPVGQIAYFCYTIRNSGTISLTNHIIADAAVSTIYASFPHTLPPGATITSTSLQQVGIISATVTGTETRTDTWVANNLDLTNTTGVDLKQVQLSDSVRITAIRPAISVEQRVGRSPTECSTT